MVHRAYNLARIVYKRNEPDTMLFTGNVLHLAEKLKVRWENVFVDKVGIGKGTFDRLREQRDYIVGVGGAEEPVDKSRFVNLRAEMYWRCREWLLRGGKLLSHSQSNSQEGKKEEIKNEMDQTTSRTEKFEENIKILQEKTEISDNFADFTGWEQLLDVRYKIADSSGKIKIQSKEEMMKQGIDSPDIADALAMTFARPEGVYTRKVDNTIKQAQLDPYSKVSLDPYVSSRGY
jgi:hypothetical protein